MSGHNSPDPLSIFPSYIEYTSLKGKRRPRDFVERFREKIAVQPDGCFEWIAAKTPEGYGQFGVRQRVEYAHRVAYEMAQGPIPNGLVIDHLCRNPSCVNPDHLECVPMAMNTARGMLYEVRHAKSRNKTHCGRGHELVAENIITSKSGWRSCRVCQRLKSAEWKARNPAHINELQRARRAAARIGPLGEAAMRR